MSPTRVPRTRVPIFDASSVFGQPAIDSLGKFLRANGGTVYGTNAQRTDETAVGYMSPGLFANGTLFIETDTGLVYQVRQGIWYWIAGTITTTTVLTVASTQIDPPSEGWDWVAIIQQDSTGGRAITFPAGVVYSSLSLGTALADSYSIFAFRKAGSTWYQIAQQTTDLL